jgi:hypothetical protein
MPSELGFTKTLQITDPSIYINECCWGGDVLRDRFLPVISSHYGRIRTGPEDWGWFIWFCRNNVRLAVDICCDDSQRGEFRIRLCRKSLIFLSQTDAPELMPFEQLVRAKLNLGLQASESNR